MRYLICCALAGFVLAAPASAQPAAKDSKPVTASPQTKAAPGNSAAGKDQGQSASNPAPPPAKDESLSNYDVNGSNASDAMGAGR